MNPDTATDENTRNVRAKTDLNVAPTSNDTSASKTPKSAAQAFISEHVESLNHHIATILKKVGFDHVNLTHKLLTKISQKAKMDLDPSLVPRSARLDFTLKASKKVEELPDYIQLKEETEIYIQAVKGNLKARILVATEIEITSLRTEILEHFVKGLFLVIKAIKIGEGEPDANIHSIASSIISANHENILPYFKTDLTTFSTMYKALLDVQVFPIGDAPQAPSEEIVIHSQFFRPNAGREAPVPTAPIANTGHIMRTIECLFITSVERYEAQVKKNTIVLNLKKLDINHLTETATAEVEMAVGNEPSVSPENLKELIIKESKIANAKLLKEIATLKAQVNSLNSVKYKGARKSRGASPNKSTKKVTFSTPPAQKADGANKDTRKNRGRKPSKQSKKKKTSNSKPSKTKSSK